MNLIERVKKILLSPKEEWVVISQETTTVTQLCTGYLLLLALIPAIANFVKFGLIGYSIPFGGHVGGSIELGIRYAVMQYIIYVLGAFVSAFIIDALATSFGSQKNFTKAMQLVVYSYTAMMIATVFTMIPGLSVLSIVGLYGLYLLYLGLTPMMQTPEDKVVGYFVVSLLVIIVISVILTFVLSALFIANTLMSSM